MQFRLAAALALSLAAMPALAQDDKVERIAFAGGELTITETPDFEKILAFDGRELARDYFVFFDRIAEVTGTEVAFVYVGPGGNACAPAVAMVWQSEDGEIASDIAGEEDCGAPAPAVSENGVFFVPWLLPGETADVRAWAPGEGFRLHGRITYAPQPDTSWASFDADAVSHPMELFQNADILAAAEALLGGELTDVASGLGTASAPDVSPGGLLYARGCVPHACGVADTFVVVDKAAQAIYLAQQDEPSARFWPERAAWPKAAAALIPSAF